MNTHHRRPLSFGVVFALAMLAPEPNPLEAAAGVCADLTGLQLPNGTIAATLEVDQGTFKPPTGTPAPAALRAYAETPAFRRVSATLTPTRDSDIKVEVWLPKTGWNGRLQGVGNGGFAGTIDRQVPAMSSVTFLERVLQTVGRDAAGRSIQLYMVPGMDHCQGGVGTDTFDKVAAMDEWIAKGRAPARITASHVTGGHVDKTRPLCPYPQIARFKGTGSMNDAENFVCAQ